MPFNINRASRTLMGMLEDKDRVTAEHSRNVARLSVMLGKAYGLDRKELRDLELGALLHDMDKLNVPEEIFEKLRSGSQLTKEDYAVLYEHSTLQGPIPFEEEMPRAVQDCQRLHHENYDGTGGPERLKGDQIPLTVRILQIADTYDAFTISLPGRKGQSKTQALSKLKEFSGTVLDPYLVEKFIQFMVKEKEQKS